MPPRSTWKGFLKVSLVSLPVKAYTASGGDGTPIHLNQLHSECNSRIQYKKTCPIHGEVPNDEIVKGYEFAKNQYVVIDEDELEKLRTENDRAVTVETFIEPDLLADTYLSGRDYYLVPDGPVGQRPYAVIREAMEAEGRHAIARVVLSGREQLVKLWPYRGLLVMSVLEYDQQVKKPESFLDELEDIEIKKDELDLAKTLIERTTADDFDYAAYKDEYVEKMTQLIQAKVEGKELVAPPPVEEVGVINLMDALKQSVARVSGVKAPAKKAAARKTGTKERIVAERAKKTGKKQKRA